VPLKYIGPSGRGTIYIVDQKDDGTVLMLTCAVAADTDADAVGNPPDARSDVDTGELRYPMYEAGDDMPPTIIDVTSLPSGVQRLPLSSFVRFATRVATAGVERIEVTREAVNDIRYQEPGPGTISF
jgi:hypothetical protein